MQQNEFKVVFSKKGDGLFFVLFAIIGLLIIVTIAKGKTNAILGTITVVSMFSLILVCKIVSTLFYIKVSNSTINVRTRTGRKYCFNFSDIDKVTCTEHMDLKHGAKFYLTIRAQSQEFELIHSMDGFKQMAGCILEKYENGEMKKRALTESCKSKLYEYKNADFRL